MQIDPRLSFYTKLKSKWIIDLNIKPDKLSLIAEKVGNNLECIGTGNIVLNSTPVSQTPRPTINKRDPMKLKTPIRTKTTQDPLQSENTPLLVLKAEKMAFKGPVENSETCFVKDSEVT
ncbi:hypothetical protein STEG23_021086 [Scotinomys teguina]